MAHNMPVLGPQSEQEIYARSVNNVWKKIIQRGITLKLREGEQSFLYVSHPCCPDLIYISINSKVTELRCIREF